jgi:threonyl-tRNA synthetase
VQALVLTVTDRNISHGEKVLRSLIDADIRAEADFRNEKLGLKVREAQLQKVPYMLVIGDKESEKGGVTPRQRNGQNLPLMSEAEFIHLINEECRQRR